jgi:hypothetical protein
LAGIQSNATRAIFAFVSQDGIRWTKLVDRPVLTSNQRAFDSQNVAFWSQIETCYACYFRTWSEPPGGLRTISRATSQDFVHWSTPTPMNPNAAGEHLYTNNTHPYFRAPHIYIALPTRFVPDRGNATDIMLMTSRGGAHYDRSFMEAFLRPGFEPDSWNSRANYLALNTVPTGPAEMSVYHAPRGRRYVLRTDGFASLHAGATGGQMVTKPLTFSGSQLTTNYSTSAAGSLHLVIQRPNGIPVAGYRLADCKPMIGDEIEGLVHWLDGPDISRLSGQAIRLRIVLSDADIYSIRFR